eukprot:g12184.t1 g12184   contig6:1392151-1392575(-)
MAAVEYFKNQKVIHKRYVAYLLISAKHYFEQQSSLLEIPIPTSGPDPNDPTISPRLTVCGDTHGQYYDVLNIFELNGFLQRTTHTCSMVTLSTVAPSQWRL